MGNILEYALRLNDSGFTGPMDRARDSQGRFVAQGQRLGQTSGHFAKLSTVIAGTAAALGAAAVAAVSFAVKTAASTEQTMIQFKTLTGSVAQAKATMLELQDVAAQSPKEFSEISDAAAQLLGARIPVGALKSELMALGNVSAATGAPLKNLAVVYGQMAGKGKIAAEDMMQFVEAGAGEIKQVLAESLGVSSSALNDLMSEGKVGFSDMQRAIQQLAGPTGKWKDAMKEASDTVEGKLSILKDNITRIFDALGQPINNGPIKAFLTSAISASGKVSEAISAAIQQGKIGESLYHALQLGRKMGINAIVDGFKALPGFLAGSLETVSKMVMAAITGDVDMVKSMWKAAMTGSFKLDTSEHEKFFSNLVAGSKKAAAETDKAAEAPKNWAKAFDSVATAAEKVEKLTGGGAGNAGGPAKADPGPRRIRSLRDGSTFAKPSDRNTTFGPVSQFSRLNAREGRMDNGEMYPNPNGLFLNSAFGGKGYGPQGSGRMMGGGLDALRAANPEMTSEFKRPLAVASPPALTSPAAVKAGEAKQEKVIQRVQGQSSGGSSALDEIKRLVAQIEAHTAKLEVVR